MRSRPWRGRAVLWRAWREKLREAWRRRAEGWRHAAEARRHWGEPRELRVRDASRFVPSEPSRRYVNWLELMMSFPEDVRLLVILNRSRRRMPICTTSRRQRINGGLSIEASWYGYRQRRRLKKLLPTYRARAPTRAVRLKPHQHACEVVDMPTREDLDDVRVLVFVADAAGARLR